MLIKDYKPVLFDGAYQKDEWTLGRYVAKGGYEAAKKVLAMPRDPNTRNVPAMIDEIKKSSLRGRGGAGFPTGMKWSFVDYKSKKPRYLAVNFDESEPGTCKDRVVGTYNPHMIIEGCLIAMHTVGIENAYIYIRGEFVEVFDHLTRACAEAYKAGYLGRNVLGSGFDFHVQPHRGAGAYICGEETGLLSSLEGDRGYPKVKPPFPAVEGAWRSPTVVNNASTIASLPFIIKTGADAYSMIGAKPGPDGKPVKNDSPGSQVYCLSGHVKKPGNYEHPMCLTMRELVFELGGGMKDDIPLKAIIPGGSSMPLMRYDGKSYTGSNGKEITDSLDMQMSFDELKKAGSLLGSAAVIVMNERVCMVSALYNLVRFYHHESCGQCTPCREGSGWLEKIISKIYHGKGKPDDFERLYNVATQMSGTTICLLADSVAMPVGATITKFKEEFQHICKTGKSMVVEKFGEKAIRL
ncbi:MAG TPA: NADH-quinone oxidoreductase subunit NuoF [Planctomycetota bacterium]|nr:NADH-quinone oxidoreductase subunit NuoF [Planctomycetota bacterium]